MIPKKIKFTKDGYQKLKDDFEKFTYQRKSAVINLRTAREMGDLSENGAYKAARFELSSIDRELRRLTYLLRFGEITAISHTEFIGFGSHITLTTGKQKRSFMLVEGYESNPHENKLSVQSPIGKAVVGKQVGDKVTVNAPNGSIVYTIIQVK
ncbi:MAG: GreA/GreB family elongation factor [Patescibacteria group bacterium]